MNKTRSNKGAENRSRKSNKSNIIIRTMTGIQIIENGSVVANAMYNIIGNKFYIVNIFVDHGHRGNGNGKY
jgi:hypothetical protein